MKKQIFYSFHFDIDVMRVQQIRNIGVIEGNTPVTVNEWEDIKRQGKTAIESWIESNMKFKSCVVVLVGAETARRPWVKHEIQKAWELRKGIVGIYIHNIRCPRNGISIKGRNPFEQFTVNGTKLSDIVKCYDPSTTNAYGWISSYLEAAVDEAVSIRGRYK